MLKCIKIGILFAIANVVAAQEATLTVGKNHVLKSKILNEDRAYSVYLPAGCNKEGANAPCPVVYLLDGDSHFQYTSGLLTQMSRAGQIPETIMVAIPNTDRTRDLTPSHSVKWIDGETRQILSSSGGADSFLDFIENELIPEIEARYEPMRYRILIGHSFGGLSALHSFITRPNLFQAHIAIDPSLWWNGLETLSHAEKYLSSTNNIQNKVFITIAEHKPKGERNNSIMETASERFSYALKASGAVHLKSGLQQFPGEDHGSVPILSQYYGLKFIFDGYKNIPPATARKGVDAIEDYYHDYLDQYGIHLTPPQVAIARLAIEADTLGQYEKALEYYKYNISKHPDSASAHFSLAGAYQKVSKKSLAVKHYNQARALAPAYAAYVKDALEKLE